MFIRIRVKDEPTLYVGKNDPSYQVSSDHKDSYGYGLVEEKYAKVWTDKGIFRRFVSLCVARHTYHSGPVTFNKYEVITLSEKDGLKVESLTDYIK